MEMIPVSTESRAAREKIEIGWAQSERGGVVDGEEARQRLAAKHAALLAQKNPE